MSDNPEYHSFRPRNITNDISSDMEFSLLLSRSLDVIGYNQNMVKHRVDYWNWKETIADTNIRPNFEMIFSGSQKEGIVTYFGSDIDMMFVYNTVICADNYLPITDQEGLTLFQTDSRDTEPGYTKLKLIEMGNVDSRIKESIFLSGNGEKFISSEFFTDAMMLKLRKENKALSKVGPAVPILFPHTPGVVHDGVLCFKCYCPAILRSWLRRSRRYNWPPQNILYDISQFDAHVVPVGCKGSDTYYQEWRICFTKAEIHLIHSFNDTQLKLYIILKMVAKIVFRSLCPEITSYIIKNIVLWICEATPSELFTEHQLVNRIFQTLGYLKKCVIQNFLPSYMIPERNLFHGRIEPGQKQELVESLSSLLQEGPAALFHRIDKIRGTMSVLYHDLERASSYGTTRDNVEKLFLLRLQRKKLISTHTSDKERKSKDELINTMNTRIKFFLDKLLPQPREEMDEKLKTILS